MRKKLNLWKEVLILDNFIFKNGVLLLCLIGIVGSSATLVNAITGNATAMVAASVGSGMFVLFIFLTAGTLVINLKNAIYDEKIKENDELLAVVISKAVYQAIKEEKEKERVS